LEDVLEEEGACESLEADGIFFGGKSYNCSRYRIVRRWQVKGWKKRNEDFTSRKRAKAL